MLSGLPSPGGREFTVYQTLVFPAAIYPVLAPDGKWDPTKDPFAAQ